MKEKTAQIQDLTTSIKSIETVKLKCFEERTIDLAYELKDHMEKTKKSYKGRYRNHYFTIIEILPSLINLFLIKFHEYFMYFDSWLYL